MSFEVQHDPSARRFSCQVDGATSWLDYVVADSATGTRMTITHTIVPTSVGGRGIAGELVRAALEQARRNDWSVVPACSYADAWMRRHPDFEGLRAA